MNSLELFSGSKTVSQVLYDFGFNVITVDSNPKLSPSICCKVEDLLLEQLPARIDFIWASPDCRLFSRNSSSHHWFKIINKYRQYSYVPLTTEASLALLMIYHTARIIQHFKHSIYIIENPVGRLRHIPDIKNLCPFRYGVNYKDFGFSYSKETDLYTNCYLPFQQKKVIRPGQSVTSVNNRFQRSIVPAQLIDFIIKYLFSTHQLIKF